MCDKHLLRLALSVLAMTSLTMQDGLIPVVLAKAPSKTLSTGTYDVRRRVAEKYVSAIEAETRGNYTQAETDLKFVIDNWANGRKIPTLAEVQATYSEMDLSKSQVAKTYDREIARAATDDYSGVEGFLNRLYSNARVREMYPTLVEAQLAYAQLLEKMGKKTESETLKKKVAADADKLEAELKAEIDSQQKKTRNASKGSDEYRDAREDLSFARNKLGRLYFVESKFADAETLFKTAFNDAATIHGRQSDYAMPVARDYERLLRMTGKDVGPAKDMVAIKGLQPPVVVKLNSTNGAKMSGAQHIEVSFEDPGWFASTNNWKLTKTAWLIGCNGKAVAWRKPIPLNAVVNMNQVTADINGSTLTIKTSFPSDSDKSNETQTFEWNGTNVKFKNREWK